LIFLAIGVAVLAVKALICLVFLPLKLGFGLIKLLLAVLVGVPLAILGLAVLVAIAFPLGGAAIALIAVVDFLLPKRVKEAGSAKA